MLSKMIKSGITQLQGQDDRYHQLQGIIHVQNITFTEYIAGGGHLWKSK